MGLIYYPFIAFILFVTLYFEYFLDVDFLNLHGIINKDYYLEYLRRNLISKNSRLNRLYKKKGLFVPHFKVVIFTLFFLVFAFVILIIPFIIFLFIGSNYYNVLSTIQKYIAWSLLILLLLIFIEVQIENYIICKRITLKYTDEEYKKIKEDILKLWPDLYFFDKKL